jgi:hypothetical protein
VLLGVDGRSDFNGLHSRRHDHKVQFYAFGDRPNRAGRSPHWVNVKNRKHPAFDRVLDQF